MAILTFEEILTLIDKISDREISLVEIESSGVRLKIKGRAPASSPAHGSDGVSTGPAQHAQPASPPAAEPPAAPPPVDDEAGLHIVNSPIVGTFYRSPNPESDPFVKDGDRVSKGDVLCIIEAMKLFNEIESDAEGIIVKIYPQTGQPVEYGERLFAIRSA